MHTYSDLSFERRVAEIIVWGGKLRYSNRRSMERRRANANWRDYDDVRRPRLDDEILVSWLKRKIRGMGFPVQAPKVEYLPDYGLALGVGSGWIMGTIGCLVPSTEYELDYFSTITRLGAMRVFTYAEPVGEPNYRWEERP